MRIFYKFKYVVLLTFCMLSVVSYGQNSFVQEIEQAIKDMSSTTSFPDLKEKYEITKQKINAYKEERLGTNVLENLREENRLTKEVNEKYYKHYTGRVEDYFKHSENWEKDKVSEFKSDLDYVYDSTIKTGYIENPKTFNDIRTAINEYDQLDKFITQTKARMKNASTEKKRKIKEEVESKKLSILLLPYLVLNKSANKELDDILEWCDEIEVSSKLLTFSSDGGTKYISVQSVSRWYLKTTSTSMLKISKEGDNIKVVCARNARGKRSDWFEISNENTTLRIDVKQMENTTPSSSDSDSQRESVANAIAVSSTSLTFLADGGTKYVTVNGARNWRLEDTRSSMMKVTKVGNRARVNCYSNNGSVREDWFTITSGTKKIKITIKQQGMQTTTVNPVNISPTSLSFSADGGVDYINVYGSESWLIENVYSANNVFKATKEGNKVKVVCNKNNGDARQDWFTITSGTKKVKITIKQQGMQTTTITPVNISPTSLSFSADGGVEYINVYGSEPWHLENVYPAINIFKVTKEGNKVKVVCNENNGDARQDWFTITSGTKKIKITIKQQGMQTTTVNSVNISPKSLSFSADGGVDYINVYGSESWLLENDYSPNNVFKATKEGNKIKVVCNKNNGDARQDWFSITSGDTYERVYVNQSAYVSSFSQTPEQPISLSTNSIFVNSNGGTFYISVYGSSNWHLEGTSSSMMKVTKQGNKIKIDCEKNTGEFRNDWFTVACGDYELYFMVSQQNGDYETSVHSGSISKSKSRVSYHTFIQTIFGYSLTSQPSIGLMIGGVKRAGWYLKGRTGFFQPYGIGDIHYPDDTNDDQFFLTDEYEKTDLSLTGGLSLRFGDSRLCLNLGGGYENRMVLQKTINGDWVRNNISSHEGVVAEGAFMFLFRKTESHRCRFSISAGFSTLLIKDFIWNNPNMNYSNIELGLGVNF